MWPDVAAPEESKKRISGRTKEEIDFCSLILAKLRLGGDPRALKGLWGVEETTGKGGCSSSV